MTNFNRENIEEKLKKTISDLPVLIDDTNNVIEFNDTANIEIKNEKTRSFWKLLKIK